MRRKAFSIGSPISVRCSFGSDPHTAFELLAPTMQIRRCGRTCHTLDGAVFAFNRTWEGRGPPMDHRTHTARVALIPRINRSLSELIRAKEHTNDAAPELSHRGRGAEENNPSCDGPSQDAQDRLEALRRAWLQESDHLIYRDFVKRKERRSRQRTTLSRSLRWSASMLKGASDRLSRMADRYEAAGPGWRRARRNR
jgi:hypothetical protein